VRLYTTLMSRRAGLRFVRVCSLAVLLLALLPNVLYAGHGGLLGGHTHIATEAAAAEHASHCHLGPRQCSPSLGTAEALPDTEMTPAFAGALVAMAPATRLLKANAPPARLEPPPRGTIPFVSS